MRIILLGPPGSGKGTQGALIEKKYGFPRISTGDLLRRAVQDGTPLGRRAEFQMREGQLVSDDIVIELIRERISSPECRRGYVLDGFPRNISQAEALENIDRDRYEIVLDIDLEAGIVMNRLEARRVCSQCGAIYNLEENAPKREGVCDSCGGSFGQREDDSPGVIRERLNVYRKNTEELKDYYSAKDVYFRVDGAESISIVFRQISSILDMELAKSQGSKAAE